MNKVARVLVVFTAVMSVAFLAFIGVTALAGPNWLAKADALENYTFERTGGDAPQWKVTERVTGESVATTPYLPEALAKAQNHRVQAQQQRAAALDQEIARVQETLNAERPASETDAAGVQTRLGELSKTIAA